MQNAVRENREKLQKELFSLYFENPNKGSLSNDDFKKQVAEILANHFRDEITLKFFDENKQVSHKALKISDEEITNAIQKTNGLAGYQESGSKLPYEIWVQTQTDTYKKTFNDETPELLYHGTKSRFDVFDDGEMRKNARGNLSNNFGNAHYFTQNEDFAKSYASSNDGEVKTVLMNKSHFADISETTESREQGETKKDHSYLILKGMVNKAIHDNTDLTKLEVFASSLAFGNQAITDTTVLREMDQSVYKSVGFEGLIYNRYDEKNEIISFSAKNIVQLSSKENVEKLMNNPSEMQELGKEEKMINAKQEEFNRQVYDYLKTEQGNETARIQQTQYLQEMIIKEPQNFDRLSENFFTQKDLKNVLPDESLKKLANNDLLTKDNKATTAGAKKLTENLKNKVINSTKALAQTVLKGVEAIKNKEHLKAFYADKFKKTYVKVEEKLKAQRIQNKQEQNIKMKH